VIEFISQNSIQGLTLEQVEQRKKIFGANEFQKKKRKSAFSVFLKQFLNPLVYLLIIVALLSAFSGKIEDSIIILMVVMFNSIIGYILENRASNAIQALQKLITNKAKVIREFRLLEIESTELVPGEIITIEQGDKVPADGIILYEKNLQIIESQITGESLPSEKSEVNDFEKFKNLTELQDLDKEKLKEFQSLLKSYPESNKVYMSTLVNSGKAVCLVFSTGTDTQIGSISEQVRRYSETPTLLAKEIRNLTLSILISVIVIGLILIIYGTFRGESILSMIETTLSLAVAIVPEGLPIVLTSTLAIGAWRMAKSRSLLKNLSSAPTLASVEIICTDKTGTLTKGDVELVGEYSLEKKDLAQFNINNLLISSLCNDASVNSLGEGRGDLIDIAILKKLEELGLDYIGFQLQHKRLDEIPFDSEYKYTATLNEFNNQILIAVKGAPEILIDKCIFDSETDKILVLRNLSENNLKGYRCIMVCSKVQSKKEELNHDDIKNLKFGSLLLFSDQLRPDINQTIKAFEASGVKTIMITGDSIETAQTIAKQSGIITSIKDICINGADYREKPEAKRLEMLKDLKVVARSSPQDKFILVSDLQKLGFKVAMTGDGVNDAPALVKAEIGISMGKNGTDVAREAGDLVLLDDNFSSIANGILEARIIFENIKKVLAFLLSLSISSATVVISALLLDLPVPLTPTQIIWLNLVTGGFLDIALSTEPGKLKLQDRSPKYYNGSLVGFDIWSRAIIFGLIISILAIINYYIFLRLYDLEYARTAALTTLVFGQWFNVINNRNFNLPILKIGLFSNKALIGALIICILLQFAAFNFEPLKNALQIGPTSPFEIAIIFALCSLIFFFEELRKYFTLWLKPT